MSPLLFRNKQNQELCCNLEEMQICVLPRSISCFQSVAFKCCIPTISEGPALLLKYIFFCHKTHSSFLLPGVWKYKMPSTVCTYCKTVTGTVYIQCTPSSTIELWYLIPLCNQLITFPDKLWLPEFKVSSSVSQQSGSEANMETGRASASAITLYSSRSQMWWPHPPEFLEWKIDLHSLNVH